MQKLIAAITALLNNASVTFAQINYTTTVKTAAAYKHLNVQKHTTANVQLFSNIKQATQVFANAVKRNANVQQFVTSSNYFTHTSCYSIVKHKVKNLFYLYCIYNNSSSYYTVNNVRVSKAHVATLLTASAAKQLLNASSTTHNLTNNVTHNVVVRTIALSNINSITTNKLTLNCKAL